MGRLESTNPKTLWLRAKEQQIQTALHDPMWHFDDQPTHLTLHDIEGLEVLLRSSGATATHRCPGPSTCLWARVGIR